MIYAKTESALSVGQAMVATTLPMLIVGPLAGVWIDRLDKRKLAVICEILRGLTVLAIPFMPDVRLMYLFAFLSSMIGNISNTAQSALTPQLFPREEMLGYNAKIQTAIQTMGIVGPILAGLVVSMWGYTAAFVVDFATFVLSALTLALLIVPKWIAPSDTEREKSQFWRELSEGATYMVRQPRVMNAILIMFTAMALSGMFNVLFIVFSKDIIAVTDRQFGWLEAGIGIGLALGAFLMNFTKRIDLLLFVRLGMIVDALLISALGYLVHSFYAEWVVVVGFGVCTVFAMIAAATIIQTETDPQYMGRVMGFYDTIFMAGTVLSMALAGVVETVFTVREIFIYGGLVTAGLIALLSLKRLPKAAETPAPASTSSSAVESAS